MKTILKAIIAVALGIALIEAISSTTVLDKINQIIFDIRHKNESVLSVESVDGILNSLDQASYSQLEPDYLEFTRFDLPAYRDLVRNEQFYVVQNKDIYLKVAGNIRIKDFLPKDQYLHKSIRRSNQQLYWLVDTSLIHKIIELQRQLILNKCDYRGFKVISAYRYPSYNERVGGVGNSRHINGKAVDLYIKDLDMDGRYTSADKELIYKLLDEEILNHEGGIGRYPGKRTIHFDVRQKLARWDR